MANGVTKNPVQRWQKTSWGRKGEISGFGGGKLPTDDGVLVATAMTGVSYGLKRWGEAGEASDTTKWCFV